MSVFWGQLSINSSHVVSVCSPTQWVVSSCLHAFLRTPCVFIKLGLRFSTLQAQGLGDFQAMGPWLPVMGFSNSSAALLEILGLQSPRACWTTWMPLREPTAGVSVSAGPAASTSSFRRRLCSPMWTTDPFNNHCRECEFSHLLLLKKCLWFQNSLIVRV